MNRALPSVLAAVLVLAACAGPDRRAGQPDRNAGVAPVASEQTGTVVYLAVSGVT